MDKNSIYKSEKGKAEILDHYDAILKCWPVPFETLSIPTQYGNTFVLSCGDGSKDPVILLHGSSTNSAMWMGDARKLSRNHKVYAIDIIGEPGKSAESRPDMKEKHFAGWMEEILNALGIKKAIIIGNSLGGWIALNFAVARPERVSKLVLLASSGIAPAKLSFLLKALPLMLIGQKGINSLNKLVYGNYVVPEEAIFFGNLIMKHYKPRTGSLPVYSDDELKRLTMPVLYLGGDMDALLFSEKSASRLTSLLPDVKAVVLKGKAHALIDVTDQVIEYLDA